MKKLHMYIFESVVIILILLTIVITLPRNLINNPDKIPENLHISYSEIGSFSLSKKNIEIDGNGSLLIIYSKWTNGTNIENKVYANLSEDEFEEIRMLGQELLKMEKLNSCLDRKIGCGATDAPFNRIEMIYGDKIKNFEWEQYSTSNSIPELTKFLDKIYAIENRVEFHARNI